VWSIAKLNTALGVPNPSTKAKRSPPPAKIKGSSRSEAKLMTSPTITTIVKMVESLPDDLQERVAEHIREFITDLEDEKLWDSSFQRTQDTLAAAARQAKQEIAAGQSVPMDYEKL
jgi:hypothetical protein